MLYLFLELIKQSKKLTVVKMIIRIVLLTVFLIVIGFFISGPIFTNSEIKEKREKLTLDQSFVEDSVNFSSSDFLLLPPIVRKYLKNSVSIKSRSHQLAHLKLLGETRDDAASDWRQTKVDFHYSLSSPGFVWVATSEQFMFLWSKKINSFFNNTAESKNKFLSSIITEETEGVKLDETYFLFYLLNSVFSPTVLLPSQNIQWKKLDDLSAEVVIWHKSSRGKVVFYFNDLGSVEKIVAEDMYMPNPIDSKKEKFTLHLANYKEFGSYKIPTYLEYQWNISGGDFTFSKFNITNIEYN